MRTKAKQEKDTNYLCQEFSKNSFLRIGAPILDTMCSPAGDDDLSRCARATPDFSLCGTYLFVRIEANPGVVFPKRLCCASPAARLASHLHWQAPFAMRTSRRLAVYQPMLLLLLFSHSAKARPARARSAISRSRHLSNESATRAPDRVDDRRRWRARRRGITRSRLLSEARV